MHKWNSKRSLRTDLILLYGAVAAVMTIPVALVAAPVMKADTMLAEREHRLIGFACGPQRLTLTAAEEDEFPFTCEAIETVEDACTFHRGTPQQFTDNARDCAAYWGDGY